MTDPLIGEIRPLYWYNLFSHVSLRLQHITIFRFQYI